MKKPELQKYIATKILFLRKKARLTQEELSKKAAINRATITMLEGGRFMPTVYIMMKIAKAFGMSMDEFLYCSLT